MLDISKIKKQLEVRLEALDHRIKDIEGELRSSHSADFEERATETEGDEVLEGLEDSAWSEAEHIRAALKRIEAGTYGECAACGEPIGEGRLEAVPFATLCIKCAK